MEAGTIAPADVKVTKKDGTIKEPAMEAGTIAPADVPVSSSDPPGIPLQWRPGLLPRLTSRCAAKILDASVPAMEAGTIAPADLNETFPASPDS